MRTTINTALLAGLLMVGGATTVRAGVIDLAWNSVIGASGYRVYYGTASRQYQSSIDVGKVTAASLDALADCTTYYVAVKAYNQGGESAGFSNEIVGWPHPEITAQTLAAKQGGQILLEISGTNFDADAVVTVDTSAVPSDPYGNPLVEVGPAAATSCHRVEAAVAIEPTASGLQAMGLGRIDLPVEIVNPGGVYRQGAVSLDVAFEPTRADMNRSNDRTDERVDGDDLATLVRAWASAFGDPAFDFDLDLDGDADVDGEDLALLASIFGRCHASDDWTVEACSQRGEA